MGDGRIFKHIRARLISGVLILIPIGVTVFVLKLVFSMLSSTAMPALRPFLGELPPYVLSAVSAALMVFVIYLTGVIGKNLFGRLFGVIKRLPMIGKVYAAAEQVVETFVNSSPANYEAVVMVTFPHKAGRGIGFVMGTILDPDGRTLYRVFLPTAPNPTTGFLLFMPEEDVEFTDISVDAGIKLIVSGGMLSPSRYNRKFSR